MKFPMRAALIVSALTVLGGCVAVPVGPGYYEEPAPAYYGPPAYYYGPSIGIGIYGGSWGHHHYYRRHR